MVRVVVARAADRVAPCAPAYVDGEACQGTRTVREVKYNQLIVQGGHGVPDFLNNLNAHNHAIMMLQNAEAGPPAYPAAETSEYYYYFLHDDHGRRELSKQNSASHDAPIDRQ